MQAAIVVILLSFCASLALPVPVHKSNQRREEREISIEELESQLEDIENHIDSVRKKVKEETKENTKNVDTTKGISLTSSTEKFIVSKTEPEGHKTVENLKTTEQFQVFVEKKTPTPTPKTQPINAKTTDVDTVEVEKITPDAETKENVIIKVEKTEEEQEHQNVETPEEVESEFKVEKLPAIKSENGEEETGATFTVEKEEDNEKSAKGFVVEKVTGKIKVQKLTNDETEDEEADLGIGRTAVTTPVKTTKTEFKIEKITSSAKSPAKSEQSEIVVEQVQPKLTIEAKRSLVGNTKTEFKIEKITPSSKSEQSEIVVEQVQPKLTIETEGGQVQQRAEDEDLKVDGTSKSSDGKGKIEVKVEKVSTKEPPHAEGDQRNIVVKVEKISPPTDETDAEVTTPVKTAKTEFKVEKITPSAKSEQSEIVVEQVQPKLTIETKRSQVKTAKTEFKIEKITSSSKSPAKSEESEIVVEQVEPKLTIETERSRVQKIEEDEDLKVDGTSESTDGKGKIEVKVEKVSTKEPHHAEGDQRNIVVKVEKLSPSTDETDAEVTTPVKTAKTEFKVEKITPSSKSEQSEIVVEQVQPKLTIETKRSRVQKIEEDEDLKVSESSKSTVTGEVPTSKDPVDQISISVEKASPSKRPASVTAQISVVKVMKVTPEEEEDLKHSENKVNLEPVETFLSNGKRSDDATDDSEEEALELELEGGQKSKTDEQKIAEEFDKALEAERNARKENSKTAQSVRPTTPSDAVVTATLQQVTTGEKKQTSEDETEKELDNIAVEQNDEAASEKEELKRGMSDEELELNELVQNTMNDDDDKEETKPTEKPTTATSKVVVIKVEKVPMVSMKVTKENNELLLSKKETAKEEKELKDELAHEVEQEKAGALPVIVKVEKLGDIPDTKAANTQDNSEVRPDKEETDTTSEEAEQEAELEDQTDAKTKRAASITRVENLENLLIM